jgi:hypothetical protein
MRDLVVNVTDRPAEDRERLDVKHLADVGDPA